MMKITRSFLLSFLLLLALQTHAQQRFSRTRLCADADTLYSILREIHPNMFTVISQPEFESKLADVKAQLKDSMTRIDFFRFTAPLMASIGDGHTSMQFPRTELDHPAIRLFPFAVEIEYRDSSLTVTADRSDPKTGVPEGAKILAINGRSASQLVGEMFRFISGEREFFKATMLMYQFTPFLYMLHPDSVFRVRYQDHGQTMEKTVAGLTYTKRYVSVAATNVQTGCCGLRTVADSGYAVMLLNSFGDEKHFLAYVDSAFSVLRENKIPNLVIDIRQNGGGNSALGDAIFRYISPVPFEQFGSSTVKISPRQKKFCMERYHQPVFLSEGMHTFAGGKLNKSKKAKKRFQGKVYLLMSHHTFSSAASFSWAFSYFKMGTVLGEESGGMAVCFGDVISQQLPVTGIDLGISYKKFYQYGATDNDIHGTIPDVDVPMKEAMQRCREMILLTSPLKTGSL
jgi:hypothetical protein